VVAPVQACYFWQETLELPRHYELEHCHDEAAMPLFLTVLFFSSLLSASDVARCNSLALQVAKILHGQFHGHQKKVISITLVLDLNIIVFLGLGDNVLFHSRLCHLVSGPYSKIHDLSSVTTLFSKLSSVSSCSKMSQHTCTRRSFIQQPRYHFCTDLP